MDENDIKEIENEGDDAGDKGEIELLQKLITEVKTKEEEPEKVPAKEPAKAPVKEPVKETIKEPVTEPDKADEPVKEPDKPAVDIEAEVAKRVEELFKQKQQKLVDEIIRKERTRDDSAKKQMKELELATGMSYEQLLANGRQGRISSLMDTQGYDEATAKRIVATEEENARLKAEEKQRQSEHALLATKDEYREEKTTYLNDPKLHPEVKKIVQDHMAEIDAVASEAWENGRKMPFETARKYAVGDVLEKKLPEILAQRERATEQRVLADKMKQGRVTPGTASPSSATDEPRLSRDEQKFVGKLAALAGLSEKDVQDIASKRKKK